MLMPFFPEEKIILKQKEKQFIKIEAPFVYKISGLAIVKMLYKKAQNTMMLKHKSVQHLATLDVTNSSLETIIFDPEEMIGILDFRSVGYYKIKQGILQQNLSRYYRFESADTLCEQFNKFVNTLKKEKQKQTKNIHGWNRMMKRKYVRQANIR